MNEHMIRLMVERLKKLSALIENMENTLMKISMSDSPIEKELCEMTLDNEIAQLQNLSNLIATLK